MTAIISKPAGQVEDSAASGRLVAIVLNDPERVLAASLCVTTEPARALDPKAPELGDGDTLPDLARAAA